MRALLLNAFLLGSALSLSGCGKESKAEEKLEKGQVVASVNGEDVTIYELNAELQGVRMPSGDARKQVEQLALKKVVDRKILADIARDRGLDKTPNYLLQKRRADEALLVELLQQDTAGKIPPTTDEDSEKFIADHPTMFADRKILIIDQIQFPMPTDREMLKSFQPLKTLDEFEQKLTASNIQYRHVPTSIDTLQLPPEMAKSILALPPGEIFVAPASGLITANRITEIRPAPLGGTEAKNYASVMVRKERLSQKAMKEFEPMVKAAEAKVTYQSGYGLPKTPPKPAAGAPAK